MVALSSHQRQANANASFLEHARTCKPRNVCWEVTIAFYELVHLAEAAFASRDPRAGHSTSHGNRNGKFVADVRYDKVRKRFKSFYEASVIARYLSADRSGSDSGYGCFEDYMPEEASDRLLNTDLPNLRSVFKAMVKKDIARTPKN